MGSTKCIGDLPDELLVEIFSYLCFNDLVHSAQYVSCRWCSVAHDTSLWKKLLYNPEYEVKDEDILNIVRQTPKLQTLILSTRGVRFPVVNTLIENCGDLKKLIFNINQRLSCKSLKRLVQNCSNIEYLSVPEGTLNTIEKSECLACFQNLKTLHVSGWGDPQHPLLLKPIADGCPSLLHIDLKNQNYSNEDLQYFLQKKQDQLESLQLRWVAEDGKCTIPLLTICKNLKTLVVDYYADINITAAFEALRSLNTVTSLTLSSLETANINNVVSVFSNKAMPQLVELRFDYYENYDDKLAETICKNCPLLKALHLKDCYTMTDKSLEYIPKLRELEYLNLKGSRNISDSGMDFVFKCKHLRKLNLSSCNLKEQSMKRLTDLTLLVKLKLDYCNIKGLLLCNFPSSLKNLTLLSVNYCSGVDRDAVEKLKADMPQLTVHDRAYDYSEDSEDGEGEEQNGDPVVAEGGENNGEPENDAPNQAELLVEEIFQDHIVESDELEFLFDEAPFVFEQLQKY